MDTARLAAHSSNSSMSVSNGALTPSPALPDAPDQRSPKVKSPTNRQVADAVSALALLDKPPPSIRERVLAHLRIPEQDNRPELAIPADEVGHYAALLQSIPSSEYAGNQPSRRALQIAIYEREGDMGKQMLDLACLHPLAAREDGVFLHSLRVEISLRKAAFRGLAGLMEKGSALRRLCLMFVHARPKPQVRIEEYLKKSLARRRSPLSQLALFNFGKALSSRELGALLRQGLPVRALALGMDGSSDPLPADFQLADLLAGELKALRLEGLTLLASNVDQFGARMEGFKLEALALDRCTLRGNSEPLFCGLLAARSLRWLRFASNMVAHVNVPPERLLRLLQYLPALEKVRIEEFDDDAFRDALDELRKQRAQLEIRFRDEGQESLAVPPLRRGWRPHQQ